MATETMEIATDAIPLEGMPTHEGDLSIEAHGMEPVPASARYGSVGRLFTVWFTPNLVPAAFLVGTLAAAVGASRVVTGVHFPSDVAAGFAIGTCAGLLTVRWWPLRSAEPAAPSRPPRTDRRGPVATSGRRSDLAVRAVRPAVRIGRQPMSAGLMAMAHAVAGRWTPLPVSCWRDRFSVVRFG